MRVLLPLLLLLAASTACSGEGPGATADVVPDVQQDAEAQGPPPSPTPDLPVVVIDAGHGGDEVGAANYGVVEKHSNLDMAMRVERLLSEAGVTAILTRREDARVASLPSAQPGAFGSTRFDLQRRIDIANEAGADLFISIHSNGSTDPGQNGVEVWYDPNREFGAENLALAQSVLSNVLFELRAFGYDAGDRGVQDDTCFRFRNDRCFPLFLLGPPRTTTRQQVIDRGLDPDALGFPAGQDAIRSRATEMPGVLVELLFISNSADAAVLRDDGAREAMARGIVRALQSMLDAG
jgi:N-acetylmuramoyl-L-alanine amidase